MAGKQLSKVFEPVQIGRAIARNRIASSPLETNFATEDGFVSDKTLRYNEERAKGGAGIVIVEATVVNPTGKLAARPLCIYDDKFTPRLRELARGIRENGAVSLLQLCHAGPKAQSSINGQQPVSASDVPIFDEVPRPLSVGEIHQIQQDFVNAASRAKEAGFDGIEYHAAHFYLLSTFLSRYTNNREDEYGGGLKNRVRMLREILVATRKAVGSDFVMVARINGVELLENGLTVEEASLISRDLVDAGLDAIDVSAYAVPIFAKVLKSYTIKVSSLPQKDTPEGCFVPYAEAIKKGLRAPVMAVGKIAEPVFANQVLEQGRADVVVMGRALLADPYLPKKAQEGNLDEIVRCTWCFDCVARLGVGSNRKQKDIFCSVNKRLYSA